MSRKDDLICPICGAETSSYMGNYRKDGLCKKHAKDYKNGDIEQCEECGKWHSIDEPCDCENEKFTELPIEGFEACVICGTKTNGYAFCRNCYKQYTNDELLDILNEENVDEMLIGFEPDDNSKDCKSNNSDIEKNRVIIINEDNKSKCITCGKQTDGLLFCSSCYHKYKGKELLLKITNGTNVEILDENYEGRYTCKDGHIVKSKSERDIDNFLYEHNIQHAYEKELPYGATEKETLHPDFYLQNYLGKDKHVYIEHWGYNENNIKYTKTKKYKMPIYKDLCSKKEITLICTYEKTDSGKIDSVLERKLKIANIREFEINYEDNSNSDSKTNKISKSRRDEDDLPF